MTRFEKRKVTQEKRKTQTCKIYKIKINKSKLSNNTQKQLNTLFKEAKWYYNYCLQNIKQAVYTIKTVEIKVIDHFEERKFSILQGQHKQSILERIKSSLKILSTKKKKGKKVGKLKFKTEINSIPLRQYKVNYKIDFTNNRIQLAGIKKKWLKVYGLRQIPIQVEIANAFLIRKNKDYYIHITTFTNKIESEIKESSIGIDFGCETQLTLSNSIKIEYEIPITKKIKRLDKKIGKRGTRKNSKKKEQDKLKRSKAYAKLTNKKKDIRNKIVHTLAINYKYICFQDESIHAWMQSNHGKKIQNTGIGGIISDLKHKSVTPICVDKFFPSTQLCPKCNTKNKLKLSERMYSCSCGYIEDRDVKAAMCIEQEGLNKVPMDNRELCESTTAREILTSVCYNELMKISGVVVSKFGVVELGKL